MQEVISENNEHKLSHETNVTEHCLVLCYKHKKWKLYIFLRDWYRWFREKKENLNVIFIDFWKHIIWYLELFWHYLEKKHDCKWYIDPIKEIYDEVVATVILGR